MKLEVLHRMCASGSRDDSAQQELEGSLARLAELRKQNADYAQMLDELNTYLALYPPDENLDAAVEERNILRARLLTLQDELYKQQDRTPAKPEEAEEKDEPDPLAKLKVAIAAARRQSQTVFDEYAAAFSEYKTVEHVETDSDEPNCAKKRDDDAPDVLVGSQSRLIAE